jgi:acyl-CoA synthetase (AMP-forming)/AMP-acid ligase II
LRGDCVAVGYCGDPETTRSTFMARLAGRNTAGRNTGNFLRTGDLGFVHDGQLYVTGRLSDLVRMGGMHYYPSDIEDAVRASHPALRECAAATLSIDGNGEGQLIVVNDLLSRAWPRTARAAVEVAARSALLAGFGVTLTELVFLPEGRLHETPSSKIRRRALRDAHPMKTSSLSTA